MTSTDITVTGGTGAVVGAGGTTLVIANGAVTYAKIQNVSANSRLLGSGSAGSGAPPSEISLASSLTMTGTVLSVTGGPSWSLGGNTGVGTSNQLGTLDATNLKIVTGTSGPNTRMEFGATGGVAITATPSASSRLILGSVANSEFGLDIFSSANGNGTGIRLGGGAGTNLGTGINITGGTGILYNAASAGSGSGLRIGGTTRPDKGVQAEGNTYGVWGRSLTAGTGVVGVAILSASSDPTPQGGVGVYGTANFNSGAPIGIMANSGGSVANFPFVANGGGDVYLGSSDADRPATLTAIVGTGNTNTTRMHNARLSGTETFVGSTSGTIGINAPATTTTYTVTLPATQPSVNQVLTATTVTGSGPYSVTTSWTSVPATVYGGNSGVNTTTADFYSPYGWGQPANENAAKIVIPRAGTIKNLFMTVTAAPGGANSKTLTVRLNGVNTTLAVTITGAVTSGNNVANSVTVAAGDVLSLQVTHGTAPAASVVAWGFELYP